MITLKRTIFNLPYFSPVKTNQQTWYCLFINVTICRLKRDQRQVVQRHIAKNRKKLYFQLTRQNSPNNFLAFRFLPSVPAPWIRCLDLYHINVRKSLKQLFPFHPIPFSSYSLFILCNVKGNTQVFFVFFNVATSHGSSLFLLGSFTVHTHFF